MLLWMLWWILVSLLLIFLIHYLYVYLKNALTIPIVRDFANKNEKRYDDMLAPINDKSIRSNEPENKISSTSTPDAMKDELQAFLQELKNSNEE